MGVQVKKALTKVKTIEHVEKPTQDDENKTFRTRLVSPPLLSLLRSKLTL